MTDPFRGQFGALEITANRSDRQLRVSVVGELDVASVQPLRDVIGRYMAEDRCDVYVDCHQLAFIDSSGLGLFVKLYKRLESAGCALVLVGLSPEIRRVFDITGLSEFLGIE